ncbi:MAG: DNA methyltransferase, partial [Myxococcaceae bacterium]
DLARATPDVLPEAGEQTWTRGMGMKACLAACRFVLQSTTTRTVVDPFCGKGTALAVANAMGMDAIGVELSKKRARQARNLLAEAG